MTQRPRRNRATQGIRSMAREIDLSPRNLVWPVFIEDGIHLNDVGRKEWTRVIKPHVDKEAARKDACR